MLINAIFFVSCFTLLIPDAFHKSIASLERGVAISHCKAFPHKRNQIGISNEGKERLEKLRFSINELSMTLDAAVYGFFFVWSNLSTLTLHHLAFYLYLRRYIPSSD